MDEHDKYRLRQNSPAYTETNFSQGEKDIEGWGIDINPANEPTYPMRQRTGKEHQGYSWERPAQQPVDIEVLHSNERFNITAVYGAANPPSGVSGALRRVAFKYGEGSYGHWLLLLLADRLNMVEGVIDDLRHLRVPNLYKETGLRAEWRYNRKSVVKKAAITTAVIGGAWFLLHQRKSNRRSVNRR